MRTLKLGELTVRLAGGADREGGGSGPMLVLFHGFGAPGSDLAGLYRSLVVPSDVRFAFPAGLLSLDPSVPEESAPRAWWMIDIGRLQSSLASGEALTLAREVPEGLAEARAAAESMLDALESELDAPREKLVLGGFSQGSMLACDIALRAERPPAGLVLMSSAPVSESEWRALAPRRAGLTVLMSHGRSDPILPFAGGEHLRDLLREAGLEVEWIPFSGGHAVPNGVLERLGPFLSALSDR